jgi:hypothetical protein
MLAEEITLRLRMTETWLCFVGFLKLMSAWALNCREELREVRSSSPFHSKASLAGFAHHQACGDIIGYVVEELLMRLGGCSAASGCYFGGGAAARSEVDELLGFLGLGHYAALLRREDVVSIAVLARLGDRQLEAAGVCSSASRLLLLGAARGLQILMDRAIEAARAPH